MTEDDTFAVELIEQVIFSLPWSQKSFADACRNQDNVYLVCEADGVIAGYCGMWTVLGEGNITNMAVSPDYRRCGIAQRLMQSMENYGDDKNVTSYFLEVRQSNLPAIALYEKMGYKNIGIRKGGAINACCMFTGNQWHASPAGKMADIAYDTLQRKQPDDRLRRGNTDSC